MHHSTTRPCLALQIPSRQAVRRVCKQSRVCCCAVTCRTGAGCVFTDWSGDASPLGVFFHGTAHVVDTVFRNMRLAVELADVSKAGIVRFANTRLANVTLEAGRLVSTSNNDYVSSEAGSDYYADDDEDFDVAFAPVPIEARSMFGEEFEIANQTMSDCVYIKAPPGTLLPGCPESSLQKRQEVIQRGLDQKSVSIDNNIVWENVGSFLDEGSPWLQAVMVSLGPLPPPPAASVPINVTPPAEPVMRSTLSMPLPVPPGAIVPPLERTPEAAAAADRALPLLRAPPRPPDGEEAQHSWVALVVAAVVIAVVAAAAVLWATHALRRRPARAEGRSSMASTSQYMYRRRNIPSWMSGGLGVTTVRP